MNVAGLKVPERLPAGAAFTDRLAGWRPLGSGRLLAVYSFTAAHSLLLARILNDGRFAYKNNIQRPLLQLLHPLPRHPPPPGGGRGSITASQAARHTSRISPIKPAAREASCFLKDDLKR